MKRLTYILSIFAFVLVLSGNAFAQVNITATANVLTNITATKAGDIQFGNVDPALSPTPTLDVDAYSASNVSGTTAFGLIDISGSTTQNIAVTWNGGSNTLQLSNGTETLDFDITAAYTDEASGSVTGAGTTPITNNGDTINPDGDGGTVVLGGTLSNPSTSPLPSDSYSASFNVTFDYTF